MEEAVLSSLFDTGDLHGMQKKAMTPLSYSWWRSSTYQKQHLQHLYHALLCVDHSGPHLFSSQPSTAQCSGKTPEKNLNQEGAGEQNWFKGSLTGRTTSISQTLLKSQKHSRNSLQWRLIGSLACLKKRNGAWVAMHNVRIFSRLADKAAEQLWWLAANAWPYHGNVEQRKISVALHNSS